MFSYLLPVDGSAHADAAARHLARRAPLPAGSRVVVLHVHPATGGPTPEQAVRGAARTLGEAGIDFEVRQLDGEPIDEILRCAEALPAAEIVMGSRGLGRWSGLVLGSVAMKIVQHARMPVTVVGTHANPSTGTLDRVLLAVDGSPSSLGATAYVCGLKQAGVPVTAELAAVVGPIPPGYLQENISLEKLQAYYRQEGERMLAAARVLLESAGVPTTVHIEAGFVTDRLLRMAASAGCSRMVMGCRGLGGLPGLLLGSVAYQVLHLSTLPVTLVR